MPNLTLSNEQVIELGSAEKVCWWGQGVGCRV
ncbi:hypothetical protein MiTe_01032 [Microcystis aeruginosa NIES-2520]|uniref:Uncharacterized protein n=1 Tax=Microcystis aeruginosa NIES-2520 TaxID=2303982 RepID=A0A5A5RDP2_MICAE|nr:hypothetical protein MiTe_01032 [Microcystis aeruginosa NIES-2520]